MISAIIITRNEERNVARTLNALQDERITEIIVVDSNSSDSTVDVVQSIKDSRIKLNCYSTPPFTPARGRYEGCSLMNKSNKYILFLDGDMEYDNNFTSIAINELENDIHLAGVLGQREERCYNDNNQLISVDENFFKSKELIIGGGLFIKMAEYLKTPGFNKNLINDEEGFLYCFFKENGVYFKRVEQRMFIHHTLIFSSKKHLLGRMANSRLIFGFGVSFYYSVRKGFLFTAFCKRHRLTLTTGAWLFSILFRFPIWIIISGALYLFWKYKFRARLFINHSINFLSIPAGFIYATIKKL